MSGRVRVCGGVSVSVCGGVSVSVCGGVSVCADGHLRVFLSLEARQQRERFLVLDQCL